ncbi:uncharacterized protein [Solanum tuberosum]|uniref:uncharacterized protein n=1 Tax=Solanum tuberosum TaxID=4113 RepID=UPI00073A1AC7|nr:PREDICTED: uncharacterized protein LOC107061370 [Solanum tuberosum]
MNHYGYTLLPMFGSKFHHDRCDKVGKKGKFSARFIEPFEILSRVGEMAYKLALAPSLSSRHHLFHVSILWKYVLDESYLLSINSNVLGLDLPIEEEHIAIMDKQVQKLRTQEIASMKAWWKHCSVGEATWETESDIHASYPQLFVTSDTLFCFMFEDEYGF